MKCNRGAHPRIGASFRRCASISAGARELGVFQDWGDERLMGWAGSEPPSAPEDWRLLPPLVETGRRGLRPHAGGGPNPDTVRHYVAPILKRASRAGRGC